MKLNPETGAIEIMAQIILTSARTAPKAKGEDEIVTGIVEDKEALAAEMERVAESHQASAIFKRDAGNVRAADCVTLIGLKFKKPPGVNCTACGFDCTTILKQPKTAGDYSGPVCSIRAVDLGIAIGSAASKAKDLSVDSRVMYTVGVAAKRLGLMEADVILALPLSVKGKNIFFDRKG